MPLVAFGYTEADLTKVRQDTRRAVEHELVAKIADELRPTVLSQSPLWPPVFVGMLIHDILAQWTDVQFELDQARATCQRYKEAEARYMAEPIHNWLREARAAEKAAHQRVANLEAQVAYLKERLEAEQRARADDVARFDAKIADLNRLLTQWHLSRVRDDDDNS
jgi:hypothetical protein